LYVFIAPVTQLEEFEDTKRGNQNE